MSAPHKSRQRGYILLFVLGVLAVVSTLLLSSGASQRLDVQLLSTEKKAQQERYALQAAAELTVLRLTAAHAMDVLKLPANDAALRDWVAWRPGLQAYEVPIDSWRVKVEIDNLSGLPDANLISEAEWAKLFYTLGWTSVEEGNALATRLMVYRDQISRLHGSQGFYNWTEFINWPEWKEAWLSNPRSPDQFTLDQLVVIGTKKKNVDVERTPIPIVSVFGTVTADHVRQLVALRKAGPITVEQAQNWSQGTGLSVLSPQSPPSTLRARLYLSGNNSGPREQQVLIMGENGVYQILEYLERFRNSPFQNFFPANPSTIKN